MPNETKPLPKEVAALQAMVRGLQDRLELERRKFENEKGRLEFELARALKLVYGMRPAKPGGGGVWVDGEVGG